MAKPVKILFVEDVERDAELALHALKRAGLIYESRRVQTESDFRRELRELDPDIIVSDFSMPHFSGMVALAIARESESDIPFIFVSGTIGEDVAVEAMKAGANDYVMKINLARLGPAIQRELREAEGRRRRKFAEAALQESEVKYRDLIGQASDGIFVTDRKGNFLLVNSSYCDMVGYGESEALRLNVADTYPVGEQAGLEKRLANLPEVKGRLLERMMRRKDGTCFPAEISVSFLANGTHQGIVRDITERKEAQQALAESEGGLRRAQLLAKLAHVITRPDGSFERWSDTLPQLVGVESARMPGSTREWLDLLHPDDRARVRATAIDAGRNAARGDVQYRLRRSDGAWIHVRQVMEPQGQVDAEGKTHWFNTIQDVTEQKQAEIKIKGLSRVHAVLSGVNGLLVRVKSREELYRDACRIAVEAGQFVMAWIGVKDPEGLKVKPVASDGDGRDFFDSAPLTLTHALPQGQGMAWRAIREKRAMISNDVQNDSQTHMKKQCSDRGINSFAILPLIVGGEGIGVLSLYAREAGFFDDEEMKLLIELAGDVSFALDHIGKEERIEHLAYYDSLTGLANRSLFHERLVQYVSAAHGDKSTLAVAVVDVDRFNTINDTLGRQAGDELLKQIAERMEGHAGPIRMARISADRFAIVRSGASSENEVARLIEHWLAECFGPPYVVSGTELRVSAKAGIALFPNDGADADALFRNAEAALKKAKATGERYLFHTQQMTERTGEKLALENKLRQALEKEEFVLHYQPKVDTATRRIESVEALIRWRSPELGLVPPMQFIPLLEETGLILEVGAWALRRAVLDHRRWIEQGLPAPRIAVNVSPIQLRKRDFVASIEEAIRLGAVPPGIDIEITESLVMENIEANMKKLEALRLLGVSIAIDDFGTGYSSLAYLAKLPTQEIKIDRSFIITMLKDPAVMTLVATVISMAHSLGLNVVAEGVDEEGQAKELRRLGCDQMQGYLFSKPVSFDEITVLIGSKA